MIFDTDVFIWVQRGNTKAASLMDKEKVKFLSVQSYMELLQGAKNRKQQDVTKSFLKEFGFKVLPLSENIGHRASVYIDSYSLSDGLKASDALIAATAAEENQTLCSSNRKHFKCIRDLKLKVFKP